MGGDKYLEFAGLCSTATSGRHEPSWAEEILDLNKLRMWIGRVIWLEQL